VSINGKVGHDFDLPSSVPTEFNVTMT